MFTRVSSQPQKLRAAVRPAADGAVCIYIDNSIMICGGIGAALRDLLVDWLLPLIMGGKPRIYYSPLHDITLITYRWEGRQWKRINIGCAGWSGDWSPCRAVKTGHTYPFTKTRDNRRYKKMEKKYIHLIDELLKNASRDKLKIIYLFVKKIVMWCIAGGNTRYFFL